MTPCTASLEWTDPCKCAAVLRIHEEPYCELGDPYVWSCSLFVEKDRVILKGALVAPSLSGVKAIVKALNAQGIEEVFWERHKDGQVKQVRVSRRREDGKGGGM